LKRERKWIAAALSAALFFTLTSFTPSYAVKPGEGCQKVGQISIVTGIKYFCVSHKNKDGLINLVWNKGVSSPESPSKKLTVRSIAFTALKEMYNKQPIRTDKVDSHIDPALDPKIRDLFLTYADDAMRFWGKEYLPDATMFVGAETPWYVKAQCDFYKNLNDPNLNYYSCMKRNVNEVAQGSGWPNQEQQQLNANGAVYGPVIVLSEPKTFHTSPLYIFLSSLESKPNLNISAVTQHELTHIVQSQAYGIGGTGSERTEYFHNKSATPLNAKLVMNPVLWTEGSAFYFGNSLGEMRTPGILERDMSAQALSYLSTRSKDIDFLLTEPFPYVGPNMTQAQIDEKNDYYSRRYIVGALMAELMCAEFGMAKCMAFNNVWAAGAYELGATFQSVFEKHFPVSWVTFVKATNSYVSDIIKSKPTPLTKYFPVNPKPAVTEPATPAHAGTPADPQPINTFLTRDGVKIKVVSATDKVSELVCKTELIQSGCDFGGAVDPESETRFVEIVITITNNGAEMWSPNIFGLYKDDRFYGGNFIVNGEIPDDIELEVGQTITLKTYVPLPNAYSISRCLFYISQDTSDNAFYLKLK